MTDTAADAAERAVSIPRGYTNTELDAARRDAQRLGYPGSTRPNWRTKHLHQKEVRQ
jgi:hypothetical protein